MYSTVATILVIFLLLHNARASVTVTFSPTVDPISKCHVNVSQTLDGLTCVDFDSNANATVVFENSVETLLSAYRENDLQAVVYNVSCASRRRLKHSFETQANSVVVYYVLSWHVPSRDIDLLFTVYNIVLNQLASYVSAGNFTQVMQNIATQYGVVALVTATTNSVTNSSDMAYTIRLSNAGPITPSTTTNTGSSLSLRVIIIIIACSIIGISICIGILFYFYRKRYFKPNKDRTDLDRSTVINVLSGKNLHTTTNTNTTNWNHTQSSSSSSSSMKYHDMNSTFQITDRSSSVTRSSSEHYRPSLAVIKKRQKRDSVFQLPLNIPRIDWDNILLDCKENSDGYDAIIGKGSFGSVIRARFRVPEAYIHESPREEEGDKDLIVVKIMTRSLGHGIIHQNIEKSLNGAIEEVSMILDAETRISDKNCITKIYGICEGHLPMNLCKFLKVSSYAEAVGIVMRYEGGGTLNSLIHPKLGSSITHTSNKSIIEKSTKSEAKSVGSYTSNDSLLGGESSDIDNNGTNGNTNGKDDPTTSESSHVNMIEKIRILMNIAKALAELHSAGIVHGDIKPDNILLSSDRPPHVRLADFGLSTIRDDSLLLTTLAQTANFKGTPIYCAPEMLVNPYNEDVDDMIAKASRKTDMYAFGILAWEVLSEERPFNEIRNQSLLGAKVHQGVRPSLEKVPSSISPKIISMIESCWSGDRSVRMSAVECYSLLQHYYNKLKSIISHDIYLTCEQEDSIIGCYIYYRLNQMGFDVYYNNRSAVNYENAPTNLKSSTTNDPILEGEEEEDDEDDDDGEKSINDDSSSKIHFLHGIHGGSSSQQVPDSSLYDIPSITRNSGKNNTMGVQNNDIVFQDSYDDSRSEHSDDDVILDLSAPTLSSNSTVPLLHTSSKSNKGQSLSSKLTLTTTSTDTTTTSTTTSKEKSAVPLLTSLSQSLSSTLTNTVNQHLASFSDPSFSYILNYLTESSRVTTETELKQSKIVIALITTRFQNNPRKVYELRGAKSMNHMIIPIFLQPNYMEWISEDMKFFCQLYAHHPVVYDLSTITHDEQWYTEEGPDYITITRLNSAISPIIEYLRGLSHK